MIKFPKCFECKWIGDNGMWCKAFPEGIPDKILFGEIEHNKIIEGQKGEYIYIDKKKEQSSNGSEK